MFLYSHSVYSSVEGRQNIDKYTYQQTNKQKQEK